MMAAKCEDDIFSNKPELKQNIGHIWTRLISKVYIPNKKIMYLNLKGVPFNM